MLLIWREISREPVNGTPLIRYWTGLPRMVIPKLLAVPLPAPKLGTSCPKTSMTVRPATACWEICFSLMTWVTSGISLIFCANTVPDLIPA